MSLIPKRGTDKNGNAYTRLVRPDGDAPNSRQGRIPAPTVSRQEVAIESSADVIKSVPKSKRTSVTPEQLDGIFNIMKKFGTQDDDSWGLRSFVATKNLHHEWSERGHNARLVIDTNNDGTIRGINLHGISNLDDYPEFYKGQAELRKVMGFPEYNKNEVAYIARRFFDSEILPGLGDIPGDGGRFLRNKYVNDIQEQQDLVPDLLDALTENPRDKVGNLIGYMATLGKPESEEEYDAINQKVKDGKFQAAINDVGRLREFNDDQKRAITDKITQRRKEVAKEKRDAKKAEANA
jgi:hypothetical protein